MKHSQKFHNKVKILLIIIGIFTCGHYLIIGAIGHGSYSKPRITYVRAQMQNIALAVSQYKSDYGLLPQNWESLEGKNWRGKVYYSRGKTNLEGNEIHIIYDTDGDNIIKFQNHIINDSVAVWSLYEEEMITSWIR